MRCVICKKEGEEVELFDGIYDAEMVHVCEDCAFEEKIPLIKKPSKEQLEGIDEKRSVRERMELMSGSRRTTPISSEIAAVQGHVARLRMPEKKEYHPDIKEDYYWRINMARRRKKMSTRQLSKEVEIDEQILIQIEKGKIPKDFENIFYKLETYFGIKILNKNMAKIHYLRPADYEKEILEQVKEKMKDTPKRELNKEEILAKKENVEKIKKGEMDFSRRENFDNITLNDLVEMKRRKEKRESQRREQEQKDSMFGDDIEFIGDD